MDKDLTAPEKVSVLMPVYNASRYLREAVESILGQTYSAFELYIINDGSADDSEEIILSFKDARIRYAKNGSNKGLIYTLNKGLELIGSGLVLRMDADDIAMPDRIERQVKFMSQDTSLWMCGTQVQYFGTSNSLSALPLRHEEIKAHLLFGNCIAHPSVMLRLEHFRKLSELYSPDYLHLEDYELWTRVVRAGRICNMNETLLRYRMEGQNITAANWHSRKQRMKGLYGRFLEELEIPVTEEHLDLHFELGGNAERLSSVRRLSEYTTLLMERNDLLRIYDPKALRKVLDHFWDHLFYAAVRGGMKETFRYWRSTRSVSLKQLRYLIGHYRKRNSRNMP